MLEGRQVASDAMIVRELAGVDTPSGPVLIGMDVQGQRHLLAPVPSGALVAEDRRSAGVHVVRRQLVDRDRTDYVDVVCLKPHSNELFSVLVTEILADLSPDGARPDRTA